MSAVFMHLSSSDTGTCSERDLRDLLQVNDAQLLRSALVTLCDNGGAFWVPGSATVTQIRPERNLADSVRDIIHAQPTGATMLQVHNELVKDQRWKCIRDDQVETSLQHLARESHVYNGGDGVWKRVQ